MKRLLSVSTLAILGCTEGAPGLDPAGAQAPLPAPEDSELPTPDAPYQLPPSRVPRGEVPDQPEPTLPEPAAPLQSAQVHNCELQVSDADAGWHVLYGPATLRWSTEQSVVSVGGAAGAQLRAANDGRLIGDLSNIPGGSLVGQEVLGWDGTWQAHSLRFADFDAALGVVEANNSDGLSTVVLVDLDEGPTAFGEIAWPEDGDTTTWNDLRDVAVWDSAKGARLVLTACDGSAETGRLSVWSIDASPEKELEVALPGACGWQQWPGRPMLAVVANTAVMTQRDGLLVAVDLNSGLQHKAALPEGEHVLAVAGHTPTHRVALTTSGGRLELRQAEDLAVLAVLESGVGVVTANPFTYATSVESPLAFSPDGTQLAHLSDGFSAQWPTEETAGDGAILIRDLATLSVVRTLEVPQAPIEAWNTQGQSAPTGLSFRPDGAALMAALDTGVRMWRCAAPTTAEAPPSLQVSWPTSIEAQEEQYGVVSVSVVVSDPSVRFVTTLWWDGEAPSPAASSLAGTVKLSVFRSPNVNSVRLRLTVTDGSRTYDETRDLPFSTP